MAEIGERVKVDFEGRLDDGAKFSSSYLVGEPFEFVIGTETMLPAFEKAVMEMLPGEERTIRVPATEAYGNYDESLIEKVPLSLFPNAEKLPVGQYIVIGAGDSEMRVKVLKVEDGEVYFDHNHELAGEDLTFDIKLLEVVHDNAIDRELHPAGCACGCDRLKEQLNK